jgi:hypothetical protein
VNSQPTRRPDAPVHRATFDPSKPTDTTVAVVDAITAVSEAAQLGRVPLDETGHLETTARLVRHAASKGSIVELEFVVGAWFVRVTSTGELTVYNLDERGDADEPAR